MRHFVLRAAAALVPAALASAAFPAAAQQPRPGLPPGLDAYVARSLAAFDTPGAAIAVVKDGRVLLARGYGVRALGEPARVDANTLFQIASNTKAFTTASLAMLVDAGKVRWDDGVTTHLPWFQLSDPYVTRELTIRDLLTHRSGLGLGAGDLLWYHANWPRDSVLRRIRYARVATSFRSRYAYDNVLYAAAGEVIPAVTGKSWEQFVKERIFVPLGMTGARVTANGVRAGDNVAAAHAHVAGTLMQVPRDTGDAISAAGAIMAGVGDLAKWMIVQLDSGRVRSSSGPDTIATPDAPAAGRRLWSQTRAREMWSAQTILPIGDETGVLRGLQPNFSAYGLGWFLRDYRGRKLATHTGGLDGMTSRTLLVPDEKLGIVVLTNGESSLSSALAWRILDGFLGAPRTDWTAALSAAEREARARGDSVERAARAGRDSTSRPSLAPASYVGRYTDVMYGDARLTMEGDRLVLRFAHSPALTGDLEHWQHDTFVAHWRQRNIPDAYVTFALEPDGSIASMKMAAVSPLADFSYDFQDLLFVPAAGPR